MTRTSDWPRRPLQPSLGNGYRLTPIEVLAGTLIGWDPGVRPLETTPRGMSLRDALGEIVRPCLERSPCVVSFSGGRDSSIILGVAAAVARREGLPPPVPVTLRFPTAPGADESTWQEMMVRHLGLQDWTKLDVLDGELDAIGPVASALMRQHGLPAPPNAYILAPVLRLAAGGFMLTGIGADELFGTPATRLAKVLTGAAAPSPKDLLHVAQWFAPRPVRRAVLRRRLGPPVPWLRPAGQRRVARALAEWGDERVVRWDTGLREWWRTRYLQAARTMLQGLASQARVQIVHPFIEPGFLVEAARLGGACGLGERNRAVAYHFGAVLPDALTTRRDKGAFSHVCWGPPTRTFAEHWDGRGVDDTVVDAAALRAHWRAEPTDYRTMSLLQQAWLTSSAST